MVGYYQAYKGSTQTPLIFHGDKMVKKVYHGSNLVYQIGFSPITYTQNGTFTVPAGITKIHVDCVASSGYNYGGKGGRVECDLEVSSGDILNITVGGIPTSYQQASYNASDIRIGGTELKDRVIVAGGGGCGRGTGGWYGYGGAGGGLIGGDSQVVDFQTAATGGTQTSGGARSERRGGNSDGWAPAANGTLGLGGNGGYLAWNALGGAGGAGYYGGGGGSVHDVNKVGITYSGGGGGSSYTDSSICSNVVHTQGFRDGAGYITISMA